MSEQTLRTEKVAPSFSGLYQHLVDPPRTRPKRLLHVGELPVQPPTLLHPQLLNLVLQPDGLEADCEGGEQKDPGEEHLAGVPLQKKTQLEEFFLKPASHPERRLVSCGSALGRGSVKVGDDMGGRQRKEGLSEGGKGRFLVKGVPMHHDWLLPGLGRAH